MSPDEATVVHRARAQVTNWLRNVKRIGELTHLFPHQTNGGFTAFVVGAGPSLDRNGHLLNEANDIGTVFSVSNSLGAVSKYTRHSVCVAIENVDVSGHTQYACDRVIAAASAHPNVFDAAIKSIGSWFLECSPHVLHHARMLGVDPVAHGGATTLTAVELARRLGAHTIVLVGCDLAFGTDGVAYASGSGWDGLTVTESNGTLRLEGREDRDDVHREAGVPPVWREPEAIQAPGWGGGTVLTKRDYQLQAEWLTAFARRPGAPWCVNATEGGRYIDGWCHLSLPLLLGRYPSRMAAHQGGEVDADTYCALIESIESELDRAEAFYSAFDNGVPDFKLAVQGFPIVEAMAAADLIRLRRVEMEYQARNRAIYETLLAAVAECRRVFNE